jgi:hypothetical protein
MFLPSCCPGTADYYTMTLVKGKPVVAPARSPFSVANLGNSVLITTPYGLSVMWDQGTRVYVRLDVEYMGKVGDKT